jgi:hypothetical protein
MRKATFKKNKGRRRSEQDEDWTEADRRKGQEI